MFGLFKAKSKSKIAETSDNPLKSQRFNDGILIVTQDNDHRTLKIEAANMNAMNTLGYDQDKLLDHDLRDFLTDRIIDELNEYLEFKNGGKDLDKVLGRSSRFKMRKSNGEKMPLRVRVVRSLSTSDSPRFQIVLNDDTLIYSLEENREEYRSNLRGDEIFDKNTGLLSKNSIEKDLELIAFHADKRDIMSSAVVVEIIDYDTIAKSHDEVMLNKLTRDVAETIISSKRDHDIAGIMANNKLLMILTETPQDKVEFPVARLRKLLDRKDFGIKAKFKVSIHKINSDSRIESLV